MEWSDEDQCFVGSCPSLFFGRCHGDDEQADFADLCELVRETIELMGREGKTLSPATAGYDLPGQFIVDCKLRVNFKMTVQTFRDLLTAQPFQPFQLVMSSGEKYEVRHPEMAMLMRTDILIGIDEARNGLPTRFRICSYLHVTAIEPVEALAAVKHLPQ